MTSPTLVWFQLDLRLADHPALRAAIERGGEIVPIFIWAPEEARPWPPGAASRWWLHESLANLDRSLRKVGSRLIIRRGPSQAALDDLIKETGAGAVYWSRRYEPLLIARDVKVKTALVEKGVDAQSFDAALWHEPWTIENQSGQPFQVFTAYWRRCLKEAEPDPPAPPPRALRPPRSWPASVELAALELQPKLNWAAGFPIAWRPGERGGQAQLQRFLDSSLPEYHQARELPGASGTSRLSPHLHFGEIGPRQVWHAARRRAETSGQSLAVWRESKFLQELGWREFAHHLLYHFPHTTDEPLRVEFRRFPWRRDAAFLGAWQSGRTGYPIVDAGMRELWTTGWMHNRARMIVASFLVKDLLISWREGAAWFWDTLVDADLAQNTLGWQWSAGCGADAAPYFRVFNPILQGEKFDPQGAYVRRWLPELARLPDQWLHQPFAAPANILDAAGVQLGRSYPSPIVSHTIAREVALEAFGKLKNLNHL